MHVQCKSTVHVVSGDATWRAGCSWEHPALKKIKNKKFIYNSLNFFYLFTLKKIGIPSSKIRNTLKIFMPNKFWIKILKKKNVRERKSERVRRVKNWKWPLIILWAWDGLLMKLRPSQCSHICSTKRIGGRESVVPCKIEV